MELFDNRRLSFRYWIDCTFKSTKILDKDVLDLPEIRITQFDMNIGEMLRPHFNLLWNACGFPFSPNYDKEGNWKIVQKHF